jgi:hypothetical protein
MNMQRAGISSAAVAQEGNPVTKIKHGWIKDHEFNAEDFEYGCGHHPFSVGAVISSMRNHVALSRTTLPAPSDRRRKSGPFKTAPPVAVSGHGNSTLTPCFA